MDRLREWIGFGALLVGLLIPDSSARCADNTDRSPAGYAVESIFSPSRAPAKRTMGLLQRSFLDLVESSQSNLEIALVVDGTDSMAADIEGVRGALRNMVNDLKLYKGDHVSFSLVIYRDVGAASGEVDVPLPRFTNDLAVLDKTFGAIQPESGAPYFPELPDLGVHQALSQIEWSEDPETTRWLLLFGDAPPYDPDFHEAETGARRRYDTDLLVDLARRKEIQVNCILCTSRGAETEAYTQTLDKTRRFMNDLATNTGGLMLDLSYPDIQNALVDTAKKERVQPQRIGRITREEIDVVRESAEAEKLDVASTQRLRLAVLPHAPLDKITFTPDNDAVQIATELRLKLRQIPRAEVKSPVDVERALRRLMAASVPQQEWLQSLAVRLRVDYIIWGSYKRSQGLVEVKSAIYSKDDGSIVAKANVLTSATVPENELAGNLAGKLMLAAAELRTQPALVAAYNALERNDGLKRELLTPVANVIAARGDLLAGFEALEQALAFPTGSDDARAALDQAERHLAKAASEDPRNPFAHLVLASCRFNRSQWLVQNGQQDDAKAQIQNFSASLKRAYRERDNSRQANLKTEILADYALLIKKDFAEAIGHYESLATTKAETKLHAALRAHWMLAGIYSGDWGVDESVVDPTKAREHLIQILAHWGDSSEATFVKRHLRWDEGEGGNQFEHYPRENNLILARLSDEVRLREVDAS